MNIFDLKKQRAETLEAAEQLIAKAESEKRELTDGERKAFDQHLAEAKELTSKITPLEESCTLRGALAKVGGPVGLLSNRNADGELMRADGSTLAVLSAEQGRIKANQYRAEFGQWIQSTLRAVSGLAPKMEASAPSGPISIGSGSGLESVGSTVPLEILPYLPSYFNLDSFGLAGAKVIPTDDLAPRVVPIIAAGAPDSTYAENVAPTSSQPFGLSTFTFGSTKYSRLVLASYESLMSSAMPLQGVILDELLATLATSLTTAFTGSMYTALTGASSSLAVTGSDLYQQMIDLRHAVPPRFDLPDNKWMLSRATLAKIKNFRASTSGIAMFDANSNQIFGRDFVINDNFDTSAAGLVVYGSWANGAFIRKTPVVTRTFLELFANNGQIGYRTTQWADSHWLAELAGAPQPPTNQALYYAVLS
jgi:HK97 family phage major capsid protein